MPQRQIDLTKWQDFRGKNEGVLIYLNTSSKTELPVRDVINEHKKDEQIDPNYETGTYNFLNCSNSKLCSAAIKNKKGYFFFGTYYQGTIEELKGTYLITGYLKNQKVLETRKRHLHKWMELGEDSASPECVDAQECYGFYSEEMNFYHPNDCFILNEKVMKGWGYKGRVAKYMKLTFSEENTAEILSFFAEKTPANDDYINAVKLLEGKKEDYLEEQRKTEAAKEDLW